MNTLSVTESFASRWRTEGDGEPTGVRYGRIPRDGVGHAGLVSTRRWDESSASPMDGLSGTGYIQQHPYFALSDIDVEVESASFHQEEIIAWSGLEGWHECLDIDPEQVAARLLAYPGVRAAQVRREFPQRVYLR